MVCQKTEVCLWRTAMKVLPYSVGFFMALPYLKGRFYLPFYFQQMQWHPCTVLNFTTPTDPLHVMDTHNSSSKAKERGTAMRTIVPREWDDQNATSPEHSNQRKKRSISKPVIFSTKLWPPKSSYWPPYSGSTIAKQQKVVPLLASSLWFPASFSFSSASFWKRQLASYHRVLGKVHTVSRGGDGEGEGEVKWTLKKDWTSDKNKIRSTA